MLLDILVPRFVTEDTALIRDYCSDCGVEHLHPVCAMASVEPGDVFDGIASIKFFNLFGMAIFSRRVGPIRPWVNPHDARSAA